MARRKNNIIVKKPEGTTGKDLAVIYGRVSSMAQVTDGNGLDSQVTLCREATKNWAKVEKVFTDGGVSGKLSSRKELDSMIEYLRERNKKYSKIRWVIVDDIDRISRDNRGRWEIKLKINGAGAKIYSLKQNIEDSPEGTFNQNMIMAMKQYEREVNARRVTERQRARLLDGYAVHYSPPGYEFVKDSKGGKILQLTPDAKIISEGLKKFAKGIIINQKGLAEFLNEKGLISRQGNKVHMSFVERLLEERRLLMYAGILHYPDRDVIMVKARHESIIDLEDVEQIQERLNPKQFYKNCTKSHIGQELPLRGLMFDHETGKAWSGSPSKGRNKRYIMYSLRVKKENGRFMTQSEANFKVHEKFEKHMEQFTLDDGLLDLFELVVQDVANDKDANYKGRIKRGELRLKQIERELENYLTKLEKTKNEGMIDIYENKIVGLNEEKEKLAREIEGTEKKEIDVQTLFQDTKEIIQNPLNIWKKGSLELKRKMVSVFFNNKIYYNKKIGFQTPEIPLIYKDLRALQAQDSQDLNSSASIVNNIYDFIKKSKVRYARSLIQGYIKVTDDEEGIVSRLNDKQMIVYDLDGFEAATGIDRY